MVQTAVEAPDASYNDEAWALWSASILAVLRLITRAAVGAGRSSPYRISPGR
jgi:hypothetical protein